MSFLKKISSLFLLFFHLFIFSQNENAIEKYTISGYVKDAETGENAFGATIYIKELNIGTTANQYGFYSINAKMGNYTLLYTYIGYQDTLIKISLKKDMRINMSLKSKVYTAQTVEITGKKSDENVKNSQMGTISLDIKEIEKIPVVFGEADIFKTIQLLPGVRNTGDGNTGMYVRGGGPDQNLILIDGALVYNPSHLLGFFSVINSDAVANINLIKGSMPAQYGGKLASVLEINMKEGNNKKYQVEGGIGLISSRVTVQGPIKKDTSSFIISARRTYIDLFLQPPFLKKSSNFYGSKYYFYDLTTKVNYLLSDKDRLYLSGYFGRDVFKYNNKESGFNVNIPWGNATGSLRWNHLFNNKLFSNTTLIFSDYKFTFGANQSGFEFKLFSGIQDWNLKTDLTYFPSNLHQIKFGATSTYHTFIPSNVSAKSGDVDFDFGKIVKQHAFENAIYINDDFDATEKIKISGGLRYSYFIHVGPFDRYVKNFKGETVDTIQYNQLEKVKAYHGPEPRISARYSTSEKSSVKASFTRNLQYVHLASLSSVTLPTDVWVPSSDIVKPQIGNQYAVGYFQNFKDNTYESSIEFYYKNMKNQVEYKEGALPESSVNDNTDNSFTFGTGTSYGAEFFFKKRTGKLNGWVGYTLSWTKRKFSEINNGEEFYAKYDRRHDASIVVMYDLTKRWTVSAVWVYGTGNSITLPNQRYFYEGNVVNIYGKRNENRMPAYHRLDLSATLKGKKHKRYESEWNFSIFNVYNRANPYFIYLETEGRIEDNTLKTKAKQVSLFPIIPSVTWNFKF